MPITNDLFSIKTIAHEDGVVLAVLRVNSHSDIFNGHFPGHPVVPGACTLQLVKDILEEILENPLCLKKADNLKFMRMIAPGQTETVLLDIAYKSVDQDTLSVSAKLSTDEFICFKLQGTFVRS